MNSKIAEMVRDLLLDDEIITDSVKNKIRKALARNCYFTSCYSLQVYEVIDIHGRNSKDSGRLIVLTGTQTKINIFINNEMEVTRKPNKNKVEEKQTFSLYNDINFNEGFWIKYFN